jgi:hypothetical protein
MGFFGNIWSGVQNMGSRLQDRIAANNQFLQDQNAANVVGGVDPNTIGGAEGFPQVGSAYQSPGYEFNPNISPLYGGGEGVNTGYGGSVEGDENNLFARAVNQFGQKFGTGEGFLSNLGQGGEGFGRKFGTGEGTMRGFGRIGSAEYDDRGFIDDPSKTGAKMANPAFGTELDPGQGIFGKKGGFMSKFGTGHGLLSGLFGGGGAAPVSGTTNTEEDEPGSRMGQIGQAIVNAPTPEAYHYRNFFGGGGQPWYTG